MSGFCGILQDRGPVEEQLITKMREQMYHRGPDGGSNYLDKEHLGFGFRHLGIIDPAAGGRPMSNEDGSLRLAFDGRVYNYESLRRQLAEKGHKMATRSDAEVILHLYEEKGTACLQDLRGMFAFVLWDKKRRLLFGARDRFGIKPFYYFEKPGALAFASELKALAEAPGFPREVDGESFIDYLTFQYVPEPGTMFSGVYRLPPAHFFLKSPGKPLEIQRYWRIEFAPGEKPYSFYLEGIKEKLKEAVRLHFAGDVPRGAFLSSGVDSAITAALARELQPIPTFSVGYAEEKYSELQKARETAEYLETDHHEYIITPEEFLKSLPKLVWYLDEPVADPAAISLFFVARLAREKTVMALSGEGADEVFGGYGIYREPSALAPVRNLPSPLRRSLYLLEKIIPPGIPGKNYLARARHPLEERFLGNAKIFSSTEKEALTSLKNIPSPFRITDPLYRQVTHLDEVTRMQYIDLNTWMPGDILVKADRMPMANSLELRVPYLDHHLYEFAATLPPQYKVHGKTTKRALRDAFRDMLPAEAIDRPKKGFPVPTREWLKRPDYQKLFRELLGEKGGSWFNRPAVKDLLAGHLGGKYDASRKLWTIMIFLLWHKAFNLNEKL